MFIKIENDSYILGVAVSEFGEEITEDEYIAISEILHNIPVKEGYVYKLKKDLTWEEVKKEPEPVDDLTSDEALMILLGGAE